MAILPKELIRDFVKEGSFKSIKDIEKALKDIFKDTIQEALEAEIEEELGYSKYDLANKSTSNIRNGSYKKNVKSNAGNLEISVPRDREGKFQPKIIEKHQRDISNLEDNILPLYGKGMTTRDINAHVQEIYGVDVSPESVSRITDKLIPLIQEWQNRPLDPVYPFVFLDAVHYSVKEENRIVLDCQIKCNSISRPRRLLGAFSNLNISLAYYLLHKPLDLLLFLLTYQNQYL